MTDELDHEPIPAVPWGERVKAMKRIRDDVGEAGFVQAFLCIMSGSRTYNCRVTLTRRKPVRGKRRGDRAR